jgi:hypothetical protein
MQKITEMALGNMFRRRKSWTLEPVRFTSDLVFIHFILNVACASITHFVFLPHAERWVIAVCSYMCNYQFEVVYRFKVIDMCGFSVDLSRTWMDQTRSGAENTLSFTLNLVSCSVLHVINLLIDYSHERKPLHSEIRKPNI